MRVPPLGRFPCPVECTGPEAEFICETWCKLSGPTVQGF